ncbi:MAG: ABC transporter substrate-binding protein [Chthonomonadales bacterium]|nr:ABC transporter substrate-binding protein [Chthonomonadales bacterium]
MSRPPTNTPAPPGALAARLRRSRAALGAVLGLGIALLALLPASCGRAPGTVAEGGAIRFWNGFTGPDGATMERMTKRFTAETGIPVRMQIIPWATYYDKLTLSLAYGDAPDLFVCHANRIAEFARYQVFAPIAPLLAADPSFDVDDIIPRVRSAATYCGTQVALPLDCHPQGLYYNARLFREAGIVDAGGRAAPPRTLDEFLAAARRLTRDEDGDGQPEQWGFAFTWLRTNWITFLSQFGAGILTPDLSRAALAEPPALEATRLMRDLIYRYRVAPKPEGIDAWMGFRQGRVAMAIEGIYMISSLQTQPGLSYAGAPVPRFGPNPGVWGGSHMLCLPRDLPAERQARAWRLMRYLSDHSLDWAAGGQVPVRRSLLRTARFRRMTVQYQFSHQLPYVVFEPPSPKSNEVTPFVDSAIQAVLLGIQSPRAAAADASRRINQVLERP